MKDNNEKILTLTLDDANRLFWLTNESPTVVLREILNRNTGPRQRAYYYEIRWFLCVLRLMLITKDKNNLYIVKEVVGNLLKRQFQGKSAISWNSFHYVFTILWYFRNCHNPDDFETASHHLYFIEKVRQELIDSGVPVQLEFSF